MYRSSTMGRHGGGALAVTGVFLLLLAAAFWFLLGDLPAAGAGMQLTAAILALVGLGLIGVGLWWRRGAAEKDRISATGVAGTGQIVSLRQTGMYMNNQPQVALELLVTIPGRSPYPVTVKEIVPLIMLNRLQGTLPVRVDPAKPNAVVIQWDQPNVAPDPGPAGAVGIPTAPPAPGAGSDESLAQVAAAMAAAGGTAAPVYADPSQAGYTIEQLRAHVRANGIPGTARIERLDDSGQTIGDERLFTMATTVTIPGRPPFTSGPSAAMVPLTKVGRVAVGVELPVKVAPENQGVVMFEWDRI